MHIIVRALLDAYNQMKPHTALPNQSYALGTPFTSIHCTMCTLLHTSEQWSTCTVHTRASICAIIQCTVKCTPVSAHWAKWHNAYQWHSDWVTQRIACTWTMITVLLYFYSINFYFVFCVKRKSVPLYVFLIAATSICELTAVTL